MKIERISENQIKIILSRADLAERNLNINELAYSNEKVQALFREMMEQALLEHSFRPENNSSLMIEAALLSSDSIMIIVTKVAVGHEGGEILNLIPKARDERQFRKRPVLDVSPQSTKSDGLCIYSFAGLDDIISAASRLNDRASEDNTLYKLSDRYYLVIRCDKDFHMPEDGMDKVFSEYGQKLPCTDITESYIREHGEILITHNAISKMSVI